LGKLICIDQMDLRNLLKNELMTDVKLRIMLIQTRGGQHLRPSSQDKQMTMYYYSYIFIAQVTKCASSFGDELREVNYVTKILVAVDLKHSMDTGQVDLELNPQIQV
jgi:hypothetical protein